MRVLSATDVAAIVLAMVLKVKLVVAKKAARLATFLFLPFAVTAIAMKRHYLSLMLPLPLEERRQVPQPCFFLSIIEDESPACLADLTLLQPFGMVRLKHLR